MLQNLHKILPWKTTCKVVPFVLPFPWASLSWWWNTSFLRISFGKGYFRAVLVARVNVDSVTEDILPYLAFFHQIYVIEKLTPHMVQLYISEAVSSWGLQFPSVFIGQNTQITILIQVLLEGIFSLECSASPWTKQQPVKFKIFF